MIIPQPNFFGQLEQVDELTDWAHEQDMMVIGVVNPLAMAWLKPPGQWGTKGADIACGELQPFGIPLSSGGPYCGFLCTQKQFVRQMPGRIVGKTTDNSGKTGFVLTLQAREQHIRRAKATSNICTNQGLLVTAATIHMSLLGPEGLKQVAKTCHQQARYLFKKLSDVSGVEVVFLGVFFHEFVVRVLTKSVAEIKAYLSQQGILAGVMLSEYYRDPGLNNSLLICVTETKTQIDLDLFVDRFNLALQG